VKQASIIVITMGALLFAGAACVHAQGSDRNVTQLSVIRALELVRCSPISLTPCLSVTVTPSNDGGRPVPVGLPAKDRLLEAVQVQSDGAEIAPFYVSSLSGSDASQRPNIVLIELDISGSMNSPISSGVSRFDAAKAAIAKYLESMQEGVDQIAIVPFESHHVVPTIHAAVFTARRDEAMEQLKAVPRPDAKNNTALFQAIYSGVQTLQAEMSAVLKPGTTTADFQPRIIVMTDGKNEVARGDDADLLDGPLGMQQAAAKVASSGLDVIGIGFGDKNEIDTVALQRLSKRIFLATTGDELVQIFHATTPLKTSQLQITFLSPWEDKPSLSSHDPQFGFSLTLPDGRRLQSPLLRYLTPAIGTPLYQRPAAAEEMQALIDARPAVSSGWEAVLRRLLIFSGCGVFLVLLWFWVPRLIWGNEYAANPGSAVNGRRWGRDEGVKASAVQVRTVAHAPDGFDAENVRSKQQRSAEQTTQVHPKAAF
jgi:Mg-chelatase subunit ChlD